MQKNSDVKTEALVIRRTKYEEADRILFLLTPRGKMSVLAKAVRREKSKLAGGIEMFCLSEITIHQGRGNLAILTSAKMKEFYKNLVMDFDKMEMGSEIIKMAGKGVEMMDNPELFDITKQSLKALNDGGDAEIILAWFYFNLARAVGEQMNLYYDVDGEKLREDEKYTWDSMEKSLKKAKGGKITANEIKMMRLMLTAKLALVLRVKECKQMASELLYIAKTLNQV